MLPVSSRFTAAQQADVNQIAAKIYLVLGNYASAAAYSSTVVASSIDASGNYPAAGAIDGDRTEINVGAASGADNDIGLSSWRSAVAPSSTPQTLVISMTASRTINRIKLYHLASHGMKSYKFESSPDNSTWTLIAKTTDQGGTIATTNQLDTIDFTDVACQYVRLTVADTVVAADFANVVEIEIYRKVDITSRTIGVNIDRRRDYKLLNPLAATFGLTLDNSDRFFSFSHTPTATELTNGFVNSELKPNIGIIIQYGFAYGGDTPELVTVFNGQVDRISIAPASRTVTIEGRDNMKALINQIISSKLKTSIDIKNAIQYALNLANVSNWEQSLDTTSLNIDYFFINAQSAITVIRDLVQAAADAAFYFDETGIATFRYYVGSTPQSHLDSSEAQFEAGTVLTNIDTTSVPDQIGRKWFLVDDFADGDFSTNPAWTNRVPAQTHVDTTEADFEAGTALTNINTTGTPDQFSRKWFALDNFGYINNRGYIPWSVLRGAGAWSIASGQMYLVASTGGEINTVVVGQTGAAGANFFPSSNGTWRCRMSDPNTAKTARFYFMATTIDGSSRDRMKSGYFVEFGNSSGSSLYVTLVRVDNDGTYHTLASGGAGNYNGGMHSIRVLRGNSLGPGTITVFVDEINRCYAIDNTYQPSASNYFGVSAYNGVASDVWFFDGFYYSTAVDGVNAISTSQAVFESQVIDMSSTLTSIGILNATTSVPTGCSIAFYTATSTDGITFDAYVAVTPGSLIASATKRYIKWKSVLTTPQDTPNNAFTFNTPTIYDVTINYAITGWQCVSNALKYAASSVAAVANIDTPFSQAVGTWRANIKMTIGSASGEKARMYILGGAYDVTTKTYLSGYYVELDQAAAKIRICKIDAAGTRTTLIQATQTITTGTTYSVRLTRTAAGVLTLYWNEVLAVTATDTSFTSNSIIAFEVDTNTDQNGNTVIDDVYFSPTVDGVNAVTNNQAIYESAVVDMSASIASLAIFQATVSIPTGTSIAFYTATSTDGVTFDAYVAVSNGSAIGSAVKRYLKWKAVMTCPIDSVANGGTNTYANVTTPLIYDVTVNWTLGTGSSKYPASVSFVFQSTDMLIDISQEYSDNLGGDSSIINDVNVQAKPLILSGNTTDTQWQGTIQTPPIAISASAPLAVSASQVLTYALVIPSGMDTSLMSGANPAAVAITAPAGTTWKFTTIHPTRPVLQITIGGSSGNITDLRVIGKAFSNSNTQAIQNNKDSASIKLYGDRALSISNSYIVNTTVAATIAAKLVTNYKNPTSYVPGAVVRPTFSAQLNDRVTIVDDNTDMNADYVVAGIHHNLQSGTRQGTAQTDLLLIKVS